MKQKLPFLLSVLLIVAMGLATFIEKSKGTHFVYQYIYGAWWFTILWAILAIFSLIMILKRKLYKNIPLFLLHISLVIILIGALCTKVSSQNGYVVLKKGQSYQNMQTDFGVKKLPFEMQLDTFCVAFYPGTNSPADYVSHISIKTQNAQKDVSGIVSMNNIFSFKGYRFYQTSFEQDWKTSVLSVSRDIWGIPITYAGYGIFMLSGILCLIATGSPFRKLLKHPLLKKTTLILLFLFPLFSFASPLIKNELTVNKEQAESFGNLWILNNGRITSITVFAHDFTVKLVGKPKLGYLNADQILMGFLFFPEKWQHVALFKIEDTQLQKELNAEHEKASFADFFDKDGSYKLAQYWANENHGSKKTAQQKEVEKLNEKIQLINMLHNGNLLQIYPQKISGQLQWLTPTQTLSKDIPDSVVAFIRYSLLNYYQSVSNGNEQEASKAIESISNFQKNNAENILPSEIHRKIEIFYTKAGFTSWLFKINLSAGILCLLFIFFPTNKITKRLYQIFYIILSLVFLTHTLSISLRTYISGHLPFSNGYETMMTIAWCAMGAALFFAHKFREALPFGFLLSGCTLLVAHLGMMNPEITPLVPVLSSPLLSLHVSVIMLSYTLLAFIALNSIISIIQLFFAKNKQIIFQQLERNKIYNLICLYPALVLLGTGIFIGAIWANVSWGRYWGWDPKEVWALITFLIYSLVLHSKSIKLFQNIFFFHVFSIVAFLNVLMTYFGVNFFLGGMHSYAGKIHFDSTLFSLISSSVILIIFLTAGYLKYRKIEKL